MFCHESWSVTNSVPASISIPPRSQEFYTNSVFKPPPGTSSATPFVLFLPKKTEEFLRTFHRQGHQVCFISFLIARNPQQSAFCCDRKPAVVDGRKVVSPDKPC